MIYIAATALFVALTLHVSANHPGNTDIGLKDEVLPSNGDIHLVRSPKTTRSTIETLSVSGLPLCYQYRDSCELNRLGAPVCPRLFILGVQKGGTTTLFDLLSTHRDFAPAWPLDPNLQRQLGKRLKEVMYFSLKGLPLAKSQAKEDLALNYLPHFQKRARREEFGVDASPSYMNTEGVPGAIEAAGLRTGSRFVFLLRDPVERAVSAMDRLMRKANQSRSGRNQPPKSYNLTEVATRCIPIINRCRAEASGVGIGGLGYFHCKNTLPVNVLHEGLCETWNRGFYADALRAWIRSGYSSEEFCVLQTSQLVIGPDHLVRETGLKRCLEDIGIDLAGFPDWNEIQTLHYNIHNTSEKLQSLGLSQTTIAMMVSFYADANRELTELLASDFGIPDFMF